PRQRPRLDLEDIYWLMLALIESAVDFAVPQTFPRLLGVPAWQRIGPAAYVHTYQSADGGQTDGLGHFINVDKYVRAAQPHLELATATFMVPRAMSVDDATSRSELVKAWL